MSLLNAIHHETHLRQNIVLYIQHLFGAVNRLKKSKQNKTPKQKRKYQVYTFVLKTHSLFFIHRLLYICVFLCLKHPGWLAVGEREHLDVERKWTSQALSTLPLFWEIARQVLQHWRTLVFCVFVCLFGGGDK